MPDILVNALLTSWSLRAITEPRPCERAQHRAATPREMALGLDDDMYELVKPEITVRLNQEAVYAAIQPKQLLLVGYASDEHGRPLPQARAVIAKATT